MFLVYVTDYESKFFIDLLIAEYKGFNGGPYKIDYFIALAPLSYCNFFEFIYDAKGRGN